MSEQHGGHDAERAPQGRERVLEREQRGLGVGGVVEGRLVAAEHHLEQRPRQARGEQALALVQQSPHQGVAVVELAAHADALRALAGEQEPDLGHIALGDDTAHDAGAIGEPLPQLPRVGGDHGGAVMEMRAAGGRRVRDVGEGQRRAGGALEVRRVTRQQRGQRGRRLRTERHELWHARHGSGGRLAARARPPPLLRG